MDIVRICLVGGGRAGLVHGRNYAQAIPGAQLVAVVDPVPEVRAETARVLGVPASFPTVMEALEQVTCDAVCIATPTFTHCELTVIAAQAGKHVFCEKPMALSVPEALRMLEATDRAGTILQIGFMRRFDDEFVEAKVLLDQGALGRLILVRSTTRGPGLPPAWAWDVAKSHGLLGEVNSHDFDVVRWMTGTEFHQVFAQVATRKATHLQEEHPDFYDVSTASCALEDGTLGLIDGACPVDYGYDARLEVLGTDGMLTVGATAQGTVVRATQDGAVLQRTFRSWRDRHRGAYLAEANHFVDCVRFGHPPRVSGVDGLRALEAVLAAVQSARTGRSVAVQRHELLQEERPG